MKNVTLSADDRLIGSARARAQAEHTTLNDQFRLCLADCVQRRQRVAAAMTVIGEIQGALTTGGRKFTRDEMKAR